MNQQISRKIYIIKFIAILMVVYIHSYGFFELEGVDGWLSYWLAQVFSRIGVPVFFVISGYLSCHSLEKKNFRVRRKVLKLTKIFFIWNSIALILYLLGSFYVQPSPINNYANMDTIELLCAFFGIGRSPINYPLWFLRDLILLTILSPIFFRIYVSYYHFFIFVVSVLLILWLFQNTDSFSQLSSQSLPFYLSGFLLHSNWQRIMDFNKGRGLIILYLLLSILCVYSNLSDLVGKYSTLNKCTVIIGVIMFLNIYVSENVSSSIYYKLGSFSLIVFIAHEPLLSMLMKIIAINDSF
uniref:acyltransferase family protein n=1 Tax=Endozoicomonas sp. ONNA2 TaxID=2828741 RepID=UPI002148A76F